MEGKKSKLIIFKYNAILSIIFFITSSFYFSQNIENYDFKQYTISALSKFLNQEKLSYFNATFFIKSLMDLTFGLYVFKYFKLPFYSPTAIFWITAVMCFGALGFFPSAQYEIIHIINNCQYIIYYFFNK
ncbi:MAG: hypothetical protein NZM02_02860 [Patescibacteria group bacterium]|nr:hypothetical protein [Patescibacteria group bacterium]